MKGLKDFPRDQWPDNIPLLYYSYHIMVGIGTLLIAVDGGVRLVALARRGSIENRALAVGADAGAAISLHRDHRRMDDGGIGPATLADLRR